MRDRIRKTRTFFAKKKEEKVKKQKRESSQMNDKTS